MILRRLSVQRFLGIRDASFEFARGINVIVGPNEAGKSTLRAAIRIALYGNAATTSVAKRDEFTSWGAEEPPQLVLEFEVNERIFTVTKDFARRAVVLADGTGRSWDQHKVVQERLGAVVGLPTEELFLATAHVAHAELERIHVESVAKELGRLITGAGEDVTVAIRRLDQRVRAMERGSKGQAIKEPGVLRALDERASALRSEVQRLTASSAEIERKQVSHAEVAAARQRVADDLGAKRSLLELNRRILGDEERLRGLKREEGMLEEKVKSLHENTNKLDAINRALEAATAAGVPREDAIQALRALQGRVSGIETHLQHLHRTLQEPPPEVPGGVRARRTMLVASGGLAAFLGILLVVLGWFAAGVVLAISGIIAGLGAWWSLYRLVEARRQFDIRLADRQAQLEALQRELAEVQASLSDRLATSGSASASELEGRFDRYHGLVRDRAHVVAFLAELRGGSTDEGLTDQWKTVRREIFVVEEHLRSPEIADRRLTPLHVQALEQEVERLARELPKLEDRERRLGWELEQLAADAEGLPLVEERLQEAEDALRTARGRHAVYRVALEGLEEAKRLAEVPARTVMESRASEYLRVLSEGRYSRLRAEEGSLRLEVYSNDAAGWVAVEEPSLSRGTVDLAYLSARLALVHVLAGAKHPPLLFDDPFMAFDERRRAAAAELLRGLSETHQIFLFTCSPEYNTYADQVIDLAHPLTVPARQAERLAGPASSVGPLWDRVS